MDVWSGGQGYRRFVRSPQDGNPALSNRIPGGFWNRFQVFVCLQVI